MGGINPCKNPGHAAATGDHGEKLTEALFGGFSAFLESHRHIERAIISETHQNDISARDHAEEAQCKIGESYDLLKRVKIHLASYSEELDKDDDFDKAIRDLDIDELGGEYREAGITAREGTLWNQVGSMSANGGLTSGFGFLQELLDQLEQLTKEVMEEMKKIPDLASECNLESSIRHNEFPFIEVNQRILTFWQRVLTAYQSLCLVSLEAFAEANDSKRPIQGR